MVVEGVDGAWVVTGVVVGAVVGGRVAVIPVVVGASVVDVAALLRARLIALLKSK